MDALTIGRFCSSKDTFPKVPFAQRRFERKKHLSVVMTRLIALEYGRKHNRIISVWDGARQCGEESLTSTYWRRM